MHSNVLIYLSLAALICISTVDSQGQTTITLGEQDFPGDQFSIEAPYSFNQTSLRSQTLITAGELTDQGLGQGEIIEIGFQVASLAPNSGLEGFTLKMGPSSGDFNFEFETGLTEYFSMATFSPTSSWNLHVLDQPYLWDGVSDIILETCYQNDESGGDETSLWYSFFGNNSYKESDHLSNDPACDDNFAEDVYAVKPRIRLTWQPPMQAPDADIHINSIAVCSGGISLSDNSEFSPESWLWYFGDGTTSDEQNPTYTYTQSGTYTISLVVSNPFGTDSIALVDAVTIDLASIPPLPANCIPMTQDQSLGFGPVNVSLNGTSINSSNGVAGYEDLTCTVFEVEQGIEYDLEIEVDGPVDNHVVAWIDYNADGAFSEDEKILSIVTDQFVNFPFTASPSALTDSTLRLRVIGDFYLLGEPGPCTDPEAGQADDYSIKIIPNITPPIASFSLEPSFSCDGVVQFNDESSNVATGWLWQFGDGGFSTDQNPEYTYLVSGTYDVSLTAQNSFGSDDTLMLAVVTVDLNQQLVSACEPPTLNYCCGYGILDFDFEGISNSTADGADGYQDYSCEYEAQVTEGMSYPISIGLGADNPHDTHVFIDLDNDGDFTSDELVFSGLNTSSVSGNIEIPSDVPVISTRLRLRVLSDFVGNGNSGCLDLQFGQVEDYSIVIEPDTTPPTADFTPNMTLSCDGEVSFTNLSTSATDYLWYFGDSNTSNDLDPTHVYSTEGSFTVSLVATNDYGTDSVAYESVVLVDFSAICDTLNMPVNGIGDVITDCNGYLSDDGGPEEPYSNNSSGSQTIETSIGNYIQLEFSEFFFQFNNDFLLIYDGPNEASPLIGQYTGNTLPNGGTITSTGNSITLRQITNFFGQFDGFVLEWSCLPVGIEELSMDGLSVFPNPTRESFRIQNRDGHPIVQLSIMDNIGRLIARPNVQEGLVDVSYLPPGNYLIEVLTERGISTKKLIVR